MTDLSTGKSVLVLATVIGCFAILWPRIFYPMMQATFSLASPLGSQDEEANEPKPARVRGHPPGHPVTGGRIPARMQEIIGDIRPDTDPLTTVSMEDGRPFTRPGVRGPSNRPQVKTGGTMSIVMPVYTIGIVGFFLYTILKLVFKNKSENEGEAETAEGKGYSSTMKKLGVDPAKLSKLRECVYSSGQRCQDIDEYTELINQNRAKRKDGKPRMTRSDIGKVNGDAPSTKAKKNTFQGMKKQEDNEEEEMSEESEEVYKNLKEAEDRVKQLLQEVEKKKLELAKHKHQNQAPRAAEMRDVQEELQQKLEKMKSEEKDLKNAAEEAKCPSEQEQEDQEDEDNAEDAEKSDEPQSEPEEEEEEEEEDLWEDHSDGLESESNEPPCPENEEDKILQILDLLIHEKVENGGPATETTKTILRLRKELDEKKPRSTKKAGHKSKTLNNNNKDVKKNR